MFLDFLKSAPAALKDHITPQPSGPSSVLAAEPAAAMPHSSGAANDGAPSQLTGAAADKGDMTAFKKHLAQLREAMLAAVRLLTERVGSAGELCEALTAALNTASAQLGLQACAASSLAGAGEWPATDSGGSLRFTQQHGAAGPAAVAPVFVNEIASPAAAAMMTIECAAAAAECFNQHNRYGVLDSSTFEPGEYICGSSRLLMLPGQSLPSSLVSAALPLLRCGPADLSRSVQGILLSLLPWAADVSFPRQSAGILGCLLHYVVMHKSVA